MIQTTSLSTESMKRLSSCHMDLRTLVREVAKDFPLLVLEGYRDKIAQDEAFASGHSKLEYPQSKHNRIPSLAVDIAPLPYDPSNVSRLTFFAGYVMGVARTLGLRIRCGADFNRDLDPSDDSFHDIFHFEVDTLDNPIHSH